MSVCGVRDHSNVSPVGQPIDNVRCTYGWIQAIAADGRDLVFYAGDASFSFQGTDAPGGNSGHLVLELAEPPWQELDDVIGAVSLAGIRTEEPPPPPPINDGWNIIDWGYQHEGGLRLIVNINVRDRNAFMEQVAYQFSAKGRLQV
jgi:hypothetical protein